MKRYLIILLVVFLAVAGLRHVVLGEVKTLREHHGYGALVVDHGRLTRLRGAAGRAQGFPFNLGALHVFRYYVVPSL